MKEKNFSIYVFLIIALLSTSNLWSVYTDNNVGIINKSIFICLNLIYLYLVTEYIRIIFYHNVLISMFRCKCYVQSSIYNLIYFVLPIISILIYTFAWILYLVNSIFDIETVKIFILLSGSCIMFSVHAKKNMIFANKEEIFIGFQSISYNSIDTYVKKKIKGGISMKSNFIYILG